MLPKRLNAKIIVLAGPKEKEHFARFLRLLRNKVIDTTDISLMQLAAVINNCKLVVSNDSGPLRFADALGILNISLFGPVDEKVYGPYPASPNKIIFKKDFDCRPCYQNFRTVQCQFNRRCLREISAEEVFKAAEKLIRGSSKNVK